MISTLFLVILAKIFPEMSILRLVLLATPAMVFGWFQLSSIFPGEETDKKDRILCGLL